MKYAIVLAGFTVLALSACSKGDEAATPSAAPSATETAAAAPSEAAATVKLAAGAAPTREFLVGKWGEAPDCTLPMTFNADGTITDGPTDKWTLTGNSLDLGGLFKMTVTVVDANTMASVNEGGGKTTLKRC